MALWRFVRPVAHVLANTLGCMSPQFSPDILLQILCVLGQVQVQLCNEARQRLLQIAHFTMANSLAKQTWVPIPVSNPLFYTIGSASMMENF